MATDSRQTVSGATPDVVYAGFWARYAAFVVDWAIIFIIGLAIGIASAVAGDVAILIGQIVFFAVYLLYWPVMESSSRQATFGKSLVGIQVTGMDGARVSFLRAFLRNIAKIISTIPLYIGFLLAAFTARKQALHDMITKCLVVRTGPSHLWKVIVALIVGFLVMVASAAGLFYYVFAPIFKKGLGDSMTVEMKGAPQVKTSPVPAAKAPASAAAAVAAAPKPAGAAPDFDASVGPALTGLEKPGTTRAGPAILELSTVFPSSIWVKLHLPSIKDLELAPAPEITVTSVLDNSGQNYYDAASAFEKGMFLRVRLGSDSTPVPHLSGLRTVNTKPGLKEQALQKVEGQVRITVPVAATPVAFEAGETGKEKPVHGAAVTLKSLSGAEAVLHYRGASRNLLGVRGYAKDGSPVAVASRQMPPDNQAVDIDLQVKFKGPVSKVEAVVAANLVERQFPFSLARGGVAGPPSIAAAAAKPPAPAPGVPVAAGAGRKPDSATPPVAAVAAPEQAKPAPAAPAAAAEKFVAATPPPAPVAKMEIEPRARVPRRRASPPATPPAPAPREAAEPVSAPAVITPKFNDVMTAVLYGDEEAANQLLDLGWWVDKRSSVGYTPLMAAVMNRDTRMAQLLLAHGADPNARGPGGVTALTLARGRNDAATAALLEQRGAR